MSNYRSILYNKIFLFSECLPFWLLSDMVMQSVSWIMPLVLFLTQFEDLVLPRIHWRCFLQIMELQRMQKQLVILQCFFFQFSCPCLLSCNPVCAVFVSNEIYATVYAVDNENAVLYFYLNVAIELQSAVIIIACCLLLSLSVSVTLVYCDKTAGSCSFTWK